MTKKHNKPTPFEKRIYEYLKVMKRDLTFLQRVSKKRGSPRPETAYQIYSKENRERIIKEHTKENGDKLKPTEIYQIIGKEWGSFRESAKSNPEHGKQLEDYKARAKLAKDNFNKKFDEKYNIFNVEDIDKYKYKKHHRKHHHKHHKHDSDSSESEDEKPKRHSSKKKSKSKSKSKKEKSTDVKPDEKPKEVIKTDATKPDDKPVDLNAIKPDEKPVDIKEKEVEKKNKHDKKFKKKSKKGGSDTESSDESDSD